MIDIHVYRAYIADTGYIKLDLNTMDFTKLPKNQFGGRFVVYTGTLIVDKDLN